MVMGADVGLDPARTSVSELWRFFEAFFAVAAPGLELTHPEHGDMPPLSLALLAGRLDRDGSEVASVHVAVYYNSVSGNLQPGSTTKGTRPRGRRTGNPRRRRSRKRLTDRGPFGEIRFHDPCKDLGADFRRDVFSILDKTKADLRLITAYVRFGSSEKDSARYYYD